MERNIRVYEDDHKGKFVSRIVPSWITNKILRVNPEYSRQDIQAMSDTALWENPKLKPNDVYYPILNRVLEEKGFRYKGSELSKPIINVGVEGKVSIKLKGIDYQALVNSLILKAKLTQKEIFVLSLSSGLSTPRALKGEYKRTLDNIEDLYYSRPLRRNEIAKLAKISISDVARICKKAMEKLSENR